MIDGKDQAIKKLGEDCARYISMLVGLQEQEGQQRTATEELRKSMAESEAKIPATEAIIPIDSCLPPQAQGDADCSILEDTANISPVIGRRQNKKRKTKY